MTQSTVTIEGLTYLANDLLVQNTVLRNKLDKVETQRDELLEALIKARSLLEESMQCYENQAFRDAQIDGAIRKAKGGAR